ncbi:MAG: YhbY family RNA-binding protein [Clostridia bacterium]|nr:YhbY family RNA-binding protein [Clostridia bacterium]
MLTSKQRAYLRGLANKVQPTIQVGKDGVSRNFTKQLDVILESRELVKVTVLENSGLTAKEAGMDAAKYTKSEFVQAIGRKFTLYRPSKEDPEIELPNK